jgi:hypothetical protein
VVAPRGFFLVGQVVGLVATWGGTGGFAPCLIIKQQPLAKSSSIFSQKFFNLLPKFFFLLSKSPHPRKTLT